jgi:hypothetical protein
MCELAAELGRIGVKLKAYLVDHAGVLPLEVRKSVIACHAACEYGQLLEGSEEDYAPELWRQMSEVNSRFRKYLNMEEENIIEM